MVEEQVDSVLLSCNVERILATDEGESDSEFQEELLNLINEPGFKVPLVGVRGERQNVKIIGVLEKLLSKIGLWLGQRSFKIGQRLSLPPIEVRINLNR